MTTLSPQDDANYHRHPRIIVTDAYLNDPIKFSNDARFDPDSALKEALGETALTRDVGGFVGVDLGASIAQNFAVEMYTPNYTRTAFTKVFHTTFESLV